MGAGEQFWYLAFRMLGTERASSMGGIAPIPFSAILRVAKHYRLAEFETDFLIEFILAMDEWYIDQHLKKQASQSKTK